MEHRRQHARYPVQIAAEIEVDGEFSVSSTENLSEGGAALVVDRPLDEGTRVGLILFLTQDGIQDPDEEPFEADASVVWCAERDFGGFVAGVRFDPRPEGARHVQLQRFLRVIAS